MNYPSAIDASYTLPLRSELSTVRILFTVFTFPRSIDSERRQFSEKGIRLVGKKATPIFPATYKNECNESREVLSCEVLSRRVLP